MSGFKGEFPVSLGMLHNLQTLDLESNSFWGSIPETIGNLSSLKTLYIRDNRMNGSIPETLGQLSHLTRLDLSYNSWESNLTEAHMKNLISLEEISVETDQNMSLTLKVAYDWIPPFNLYDIWMRDCQIGFPVWLQSQNRLVIVDLHNTGIVGTIPEKWLSSISPSVELLDLSYNQIRGKFPVNLKFPHLVVVYLDHNRFEGPLPRWFSSAMQFDVRNNLFSGSIPSNFGKLMPGLHELFLLGNQLNGTIPSSIYSMKNLHLFTARSNQLSGEFPHAWSLWSEIWFVDVANNKLSGDIPSSMGIPGSLLTLKMNDNNFGGKIPYSIFQNCTSLKIVDLGGNRLSGSIPLLHRSNVSMLYMLRLRSNLLSGSIPDQLCHMPSLQIIDLGGNNFSGTIPKCLKYLTSLIDGNSTTTNPLEQDDGDYYLPEITLTLKGQQLIYNTTLKLVKSIDLSSNNLEGEIPEEITSLTALGTLNLSMNRLSGRIPSKIGNLGLLETLDVSHNHLSGQIPQSLSSLTMLAHLNFSYNNLTGRIPSGNQLQTLDDPSIYVGNPSLCGFPLINKCSEDSTPAPPSPGDEEKDDSENLGFYVSIIIGSLISFWGVCRTLLVKKSWRYAYFRFFDDIMNTVAVAITSKVAHFQA